MRRMFGAMVAGLALVAAAGAAQAAQVVDQESVSGFSIDVLTTDEGLSTYGQTFTPSLAGIDFARFYFMSPSTETFRVRVYEGRGAGGTLLGTSDAGRFLTDQVMNLDGEMVHPVEFLFPTRVTLTPQSLYTLTVSGLNFGVYMRYDAAYPGGGRLSNGIGGGESNNFDLVFAEGINAVAAVPEPATWAMMIAGFGLVGGAMRRRTAGVATAA